MIKGILKNESALKTIITFCYVRENYLLATAQQPDKTRAKTSIKLIQEKLLTHVPFAV
jgi:hypothetical protein